MIEIPLSDVNETCKLKTGEVIKDGRQWFVMRDLTRSNARHPAYLMLKELKLRYFTPMVTKLMVRNGRREAVESEYIPVSLFAEYQPRTHDGAQGRDGKVYSRSGVVEVSALLSP